MFVVGQKECGLTSKTKELCILTRDKYRTKKRYFKISYIKMIIIYIVF